MNVCQLLLLCQRNNGWMELLQNFNREKLAILNWRTGSRMSLPALNFFEDHKTEQAVIPVLHAFKVIVLQ